MNASKKVLKGNHADHIHDHCDCIFAIRFDDSMDVDGYDPKVYRRIYDRNNGDLNAMSRELYPQIKDKRNARRRELYSQKKEIENALSDEEYIKKKMSSGEWGTTINKEKQADHMGSTRKPGKSYLFDSEDPQELFDKYSGKGELIVTATGKRTNKERVKVDHVVGVDYNSGEETQWITIHHSKNRTHIVPFKKMEKDS